LSRRCESLDLSHPYGLSRPVTKIALLSFLLTILTEIRNRILGYGLAEIIKEYMSERSNSLDMNCEPWEGEVKKRSLQRNYNKGKYERNLKGTKVMASY
jgi:hypothetical protein